MIASLVFTIFAVHSAPVSALHELPERARGGSAYKSLGTFRQRSSNALTWNAPLDNFDFSNATFEQRYYVNDEFWDPESGPVFFEIGGEGTLSGPPGGFIAELAQSYSALIVALEHRFYGESIPNGNAFTENYNKYLSVEQALGDLSSFTKYFQQKVPATADASWFVFGGSYPGALSSWYRAAYPEMSVGSLSSSGVVNCIVDYIGFDMQVSAAAGNMCSDKIKRVQTAFQRTYGKRGLQYPLSLFNCEKDMSVNDFFYMIADSWSMAVQYSSKSKLCGALEAIDGESTDDEVMKIFANFSNDFWGEDFCSGGFYNTKALADPERWDVNSRSWRYQTCSQVSYFNTAPPSGSLRAESVNLDYHLEQCAAIFGQKMFPASKEINDKFGGAFPISATNVFYSDFSDDPWQRASVTYPVATDQPYCLAQCDDCGHCMDFHAPNPETDPPQLQQCRDEFSQYLTRWLDEAKAAKN